MNCGKGRSVTFKTNKQDSRINQQYYKISDSEYTICKVFVRNKAIYELWKQKEVIKRADSAEELINDL